MRSIAFALPFTLLVAACGGGSSPNSGDAPKGTGDSGGSDGSAGEMFSLTWGPIDVGAGVEDTQCIWLHLGNTQEIKVNQIHNLLSPVSHHLIVYKDDMDTTEQTTPVPCQPFTGALNSSGNIEPVIITQKKDDLLTLPDHVAYTFAPNQMIKIEMHYINTTDSDAQGSASVNVISADPATITDEAAVLFNGSPDINIPAGAVPGAPGTIVHEFMTLPSYLDLSASHVFAITGHTHKHGINMTVSTAATKGGTLTPVYAPDPFQWAEPETTQQNPPFSVPVGGGFDFECDYDNTSGSAAVQFGESANDEMCFFWAYYYPALTTASIKSGSRVCIHTDNPQAQQELGEADACCPGDSLCALIDAYLGMGN